MRVTLVAITMTALLAGLADATPGRSLAKRKVEKKRDANKALAAARPAPEQAAPASAPSKTKPATGTTTAAKPTPQSAPAPAAPKVDPATATSKLSRTNKPPSTRFHSRVRSDVSRDKSKKVKVATQQAADPAKPAVKTESYRRTWGPRSRNRRK